ncbi:MAG: hypothetical protein WCH57_05495 [Verrucomicrobiota bacterium]
MSTLNLSQISAAVDAAFQTTLALANPVRIAPQAIGDNATLRTDVYTGPKGAGFVVVATMDLKWRTLVIAKQHGAETSREQAAPTLASLLAECDAKRAAAYESRGCSDKDYVDAITKRSSSDATVKAEGDAQLTAVLAGRLKVKADIPKPN